MSVAVTVIFCYLLASTVATRSPKNGLSVGFYAWSCPQAEIIVRNAVEKAVEQNPETAAGLIRMHFHDCFVRGCDGSILLDSISGVKSEKESPVNYPSLHGFEVIDEAKAQLEAQCPDTVSCSDILAFAARDSASVVGNIQYYVPSGRRDGVVSIESEVIQNLPQPTFNAQKLIDSFADKGLSVRDMVTLSGAHSIGVSHCSSFRNRLYNFNTTHPQDPSMDPSYAILLKKRCPNVQAGQDSDPTMSMDAITPTRLDNQYYKGVTLHRAILTSDQTLTNDKLTSTMVMDHARHGAAWGTEFGNAMVRMGFIEVLTGIQGQIRNNCRFINQNI